MKCFCVFKRFSVWKHFFLRFVKNRVLRMTKNWFVSHFWHIIWHNFKHKKIRNTIINQLPTFKYVFFLLCFLLFYDVLYKINLFLFLELFLISGVNTVIIRCPDVGTFPMREIWISRAEISIRVAVHLFGSCFNAVDIIKALEVSQHLMPPLPCVRLPGKDPVMVGLPCFSLKRNWKELLKYFVLRLYANNR